jgi:hypothetical protein
MNPNKYPHLQGKRIKFFTRSFLLEMYRLACKLFDNQGIECVRLTDQMADGYFFTILKEINCDIAINIDEDAFVTDMDAIWDLADYVVEHDYVNAGCPDGGIGVARGLNPIVTNPFFNILNLELIRTLPIDKKKINKFDYLAVKDEMIAAFPKEMLFDEHNFNCYDFEPYYPFFFWLAYNFKTLYLLGKRHTDNRSTILYNHKQQPICYHSWFARFYKIKTEQTKRINALIDEVYEIRKMAKPVFSFKDKCLFFMDFFLRRTIRIPMRIANWPNKWKKWCRRSREKRKIA